MSTETHAPAPALPEGEHSLHLRGFDREVHVPWVLITGVSVAVITLLSFVACWYGLKLMEHLDEGHEQPMSAIEESAPQGPMMLPALQVSPEDDLQAMRAEEEKGLHQPWMVDAQSGTARLPIDVALDVVLQRGVAPLEAGAPAPGEPMAPTAPAPEAVPVDPAPAAGAPAAPPATPPPGGGGH
jgi:hypothetical protein